MRSPHLLCAMLWLAVTASTLPCFAQDSASSSASSAATVRVAGQVLDSQNAVPLPGVTVELVNSEIVAYTDVDGKYVLDVPAGTHEVKVTLDGYKEQVLRVNADAGAPVDVDVSLTMAGFTEQVTVTADVVEGSASSAATLLTERRRAPVISDNLGSTEMRQNADSNAAAGMQRVTGLSVVDNQYVFVRGLGERYSTTTLNGATLPTTEPDRRVVPLDLFPAGLIDSVRVTKSYSPDQPGDFAGGVVEIQPLRLPPRPVLDASFTIGFNSQTVGETGLGYPGGGRDFLGYGKGARALPAGFPTEKVTRGGIFTPEVGFPREDLEPIGESLANTWEARPRDSRPEQSYNLVYGSRFGRLGVVASLTQAYEEQFSADELQRFFRVGEDDELSVFSDYAFQTSTLNARTGAVGNVAWEFSPSHRLGVNNFYTHTGRDETRIYEGFNSDINTEVRDTRLFWTEEALLTNQVTGEHYLQGLANSRVDWRVAYARADRDEPDLRQTLYELQGGEFVLADESQSGFRMFSTLDDQSVDLALNWSIYTTTWASQPMMIKFGPSFIRRERDFESRRFRFIPLVTFDADRALSPEQLFTPANIGPDTSFELREETRPTDAYGADQDIYGGYAMVDVPLSNQFRLVGGARVERFNQTVDTFDPFSFVTNPEIIRAEIETTDVLPSANLIYATTPSSNLRIGFSQTVNRPEFRELAPFEFTDVVGGRAVVGNPNLERALIRNVDVRWEWFPGAEEVVAASVFLKQFEDPIERIVEATAQLRTSYTNADSARNVGIELEGRKALTPWLVAGANYTFVDSEIELTAAARQVQTSLSRPLAGTSRHLFNALGELRFAERSSVRVLYNFFGDRIADVGSEGLPDIIQAGRGGLDLVFSHQLAGRLNLRVSGVNLIDDPFEFEQGGQLQRSYEVGRTFSFSLGVSAF
ncbi:MAG: TonB-dependent receptor [Luteitalea sp.]|nr:TonB-dependent receptor [Luteitalea sp.]